MYLLNKTDCQDADNLRRAKTPELMPNISKINVLLKMVGNRKTCFKPKGFYTQANLVNIKLDGIKQASLSAMLY